MSDAIPRMTVVLLFAVARDIAGADRVELALPAGATVADVRVALGAAFPALASLLARSAMAVNCDMADDRRAIAPGDEIAVIPPVSGG